MKQEPVGRYYWESVADGHFMAVPSEGTIYYKIDDFPLYTHPHKELSDEEILSFQWMVHYASADELIDFARAIIKASRGEE